MRFGGAIMSGMIGEPYRPMLQDLHEANQRLTQAHEELMYQIAVVRALQEALGFGPVVDALEEMARRWMWGFSRN